MSKKLSKLFESEIEKAQIVMAVRNDIVDKLQRDAEKMGNMKIDILGPIVDRIKAEHGVDAAAAFRETVGSLLDQALTTLQDVQDKISTETLKLTGDVASTTDLASDFSLDASAEEMAPGFDFGGEESFSTEAPEPLPAEREVKESVEPKKRIGIELTTKLGKSGKKFFESKEDMRQWITENREQIKEVHRVFRG